MTKNLNFFLKVISIIVLVLSCFWSYYSFGFEPAIAIFVSLNTLIGLFVEQTINKNKLIDKLIRHNGVYFDKDEYGNKTGDSYCPRCVESERKLIHLVQKEANYFRCPECGNDFGKPEEHFSEAGG